MNKAWDRSKDVANPINEDDRNMVKQSIMEALLRAPSAVQYVITRPPKEENLPLTLTSFVFCQSTIDFFPPHYSG